MSTSKIPTDGRAFAVFIGSLPKPAPWGAGRKFAQRIGSKTPAPNGAGKKFAEAIRDRRK